MARPKVYENVTIEDIDMKGHGVAQVDGYVLFIENTLPGDVVDVAVRRRRSGHGICSVIARRSDGISRIEPFCEHFADCGGCVWQDIPYDVQCRLKSRIVEQSFVRFGVGGAQSVDETQVAGSEGSGTMSAEPVCAPVGKSILASEATTEYRNRLDYSFSSRRWISRSEAETAGDIPERAALGFHAPKRFDKVVEINRCHLQPEPTNRIRNAVAEFTLERGYRYYDSVENTGLLRNLVVRTSLAGETMVLLVFGADVPEIEAQITTFLRDRFPEITSCYCMTNVSNNDDLSKHGVRLSFGAPTITERCGHIELSIHPKSFYQTNPRQAERLFEIVRDWAGLGGDEHVLDLYCGIGSIGLFLADRCRKVTGLEIIPEAIERATQNAERNGIRNAEFLVGAAEDTLGEWFANGEVPDLLVADPPRAGLHNRVIEVLREVKVPRIIYVSCNPRSQAENIASLLDIYDLKRYRPVDMFPHTRHVENIAELVLR